MRATILFWSRVPSQGEAGAPLSAHAAANILGASLDQVWSAFEGWASRGMPETHFREMDNPDLAPYGWEIFYYQGDPPPAQGFIMQSRRWGNGTRRAGKSVPFTVEIVVEIGGA